jgi:hypothetical protein
LRFASAGSGSRSSLLLLFASSCFFFVRLWIGHLWEIWRIQLDSAHRSVAFFFWRIISTFIYYFFLVAAGRDWSSPLASSQG